MAEDKIKTPSVERLLEAFARTDDADGVYDLLLDLCTVREIAEMSQRLEVARMLSEHASYVAIQEATGASATTISRVSKCLNYGSGGYARAIGAASEAADDREGR